MLDQRRREIEIIGRVREFIFGIQDGLISNVGLLAGLQTATQGPKVVILGGLAGMLAGGLSMAPWAYLSSKAEKEIFDKELRDQERLVDQEEYLAQEGLLQAFQAEGLDRESSFRIVKRLSRTRPVFLATFQVKVLGLGTAELNKPVQAAAVMWLSFVAGAFLTMIPYLLVTGIIALVSSVAITGVVLFGVGAFKGVLAKKRVLISGLEFFAVAVGSGTLGFLVGLPFA